MVFGKTLFICNDCGNRFIAPMAEWRATVYIAPMPCKKCGSVHTYPLGLNNLGGLLGPEFYRNIWEVNEK